MLPSAMIHPTDTKDRLPGACIRNKHSAHLRPPLNNLNKTIKYQQYNTATAAQSEVMKSLDLVMYGRYT